jgi:HEAT repeat protein
VGSDDKGVLRAKLCAAAPCDVSGGLALEVPQELKAQIPSAKLAIVGIGGGRRAIVVTVPGARDGRAFQAVVVAPLAGAVPKVVFAEVTGLSEGADGVRQGKVVNISEPDEDGARHIVVGIAREDLDLCGRPAVLAPELLSSKDLALHPARVQRLPAALREQAPKLVAELVAEGAAPATQGVLRALGASSAIGAPGALTDGRPDTAWAENRGGAGRGEFVVLSAPSELPLAGFEFVVLPPGAAATKSSVPRELWLTTRKDVYAVTLPEEATRVPGARFRVTLPKPVQTDCVALVTESAFEERADSRVAVAELAAVTELGSIDPAGLAAALAGGGERAKAAGAVLRALGAPGFAEIVKKFDALDEGGRRVALDVIDAAPAEVSAPVYASALLSSSEAQRTHAQDHLRRCGRACAPVLTERFQASKGAQAQILADELAILAPDQAVSLLAARIGTAPARERRALRVVLARAAANTEARPSVTRLLADAALPSVAALDLLRALGPRAPSFLPEAGQTLNRLHAETNFATRYLLLAPAGVLAPRDPNARAVVQQALTDAKEPRLRVRALEVLPRDAAGAPGFLTALSDSDVRVREAAAVAVREGRFAQAAPKLVALLDDDFWPIVRRAAADALAVLPPEPQGDAGLVDALSDEAAWVRASVASALGARRVVRAAPALRERLENKEEHFDVRRAAVAALAALCDQESVGTLTELAKRLADPMATVEDRAIGEAALEALAAIGPSDLNARLAPLSGTRAAPAVKHALASAAHGKACRRR